MALQTLSRLFLFSALVATGISLECETCFNRGSSCTGRMETCAAGEDICSINLVENGLMGTTGPSSVIPGILSTPDPGIFQNPKLPRRSDDGILRSIQKGCEGLPFCKFDDVYMNIGRKRTLRGRNICCKGSACQNISVNLPPVHEKPNGKKCPACFAVSKPCPEKTVRCTGPEKHCFDVKLIKKIGPLGIIIKATAKGCATKSFCDLSQTRGKMYGRVGFRVEESYCDSGSKAPGSFGPHLLALSSLLLMMFLV